MLNIKLLLDEGQTIAQIIQLGMTRKVDKSFIPIGIREFDKAMDGGLRTGELVVISGETGQGKTTYAQTLTCNLSKDNTPTFWFSYEMMDYYLAEKFKKMGMTYKDPIYAPVELSSGALDFIEKEINEAKKNQWIGCKVVFIDHLHYLIPLEASGSNSSMAIGAIVRGLKKIAIKQEVVICLIAHTKKIYQDESLDLSSVRDSSLICQEADYVFLVARERIEKEKPKRKMGDKPVIEKKPDYGTDWSNTTMVKLAKNRRLGVMINLRFILQDNKLISTTKIYDENDAIQDDTII